MTTLLLTFVIFGICLLGLAIGVILNGMTLQGSCGGAAKVLGKDSCGCGRRNRDVCPSEDETGLLHLAELGDPSRIVRHSHHDEGMSV